jgi:rubrerythrin
MDTKTRRGLQSALAHEAEEVVRYLLYAEQAYGEGLSEVAALFERAARLEALEHAREQALLLGAVGTTAQNLCRAMVSEQMDCDQLYPDVARQAAAAGDDVVAVLLRDLAAEKRQQTAEFRAACLNVCRSVAREAAGTSPHARAPVGVR